MRPGPLPSQAHWIAFGRGQIVLTDIVASASGIEKFFAKDAKALDGVDITIRPGKVTGLVGPDGAGKTTLIRILAGLMAPNAGSVDILGAPPAQRLDEIGYMPQRFGLYEDLTVRENLTLYAELRALPRADHDAVFERLFQFTDLGRFQSRLAGRLSGGMKQKLGLACALVRTPRLLLLDEPGVGVDPISRRELWAMVHELTGQGIGVLWSTAYLDEAELCDDVCLLNQGKLIFEGLPAELTGAVDGRVIRVTGFKKRRRDALTDALDRPDIIDGTIQGRAIRLLVRDGHDVPDAKALDMGPDTQVAPAAPRFEDGFIERLGGGPKGTSRLAAAYREIPPSDRPAIEALGLTKRFGEFTAASDVRFSVPRGQIFGLLGPNGAGKSTTFKMLCGLLTPTAGTGTVAGHDLRRARGEARASLGYMAQKFSLYGDLSVQQRSRFLCGCLRSFRYGGAQGNRSGDGHFRAGAASETQRRRASAGLQAASRPGLRRPASAERAFSRRAHFGRRSRHATRVLDAHQWPGGARRDRAGDDSLHG